jgi:hypothetical protein
VRERGKPRETKPSEEGVDKPKGRPNSASGKTANLQNHVWRHHLGEHLDEQPSKIKTEQLNRLNKQTKQKQNAQAEQSSITVPNHT